MEKKHSIQGGGGPERGVRAGKKREGSVLHRREKRGDGWEVKRWWCFVLEQSVQQDIAAVSFQLIFFPDEKYAGRLQNF